MLLGFMEHLTQFYLFSLGLLHIALFRRASLPAPL